MSLIDLILKKYGVNMGDYVKIRLSNGMILKGIIMPKHMYSKGAILIIKLDNGYNIGINISKIEEVERAKPPEIKMQTIPFEKRERRDLPRILLLGVGGIILSRVDYRAGGVRSAISADEIIEILPELPTLMPLNIVGEITYKNPVKDMRWNYDS